MAERDASSGATPAQHSISHRVGHQEKLRDGFRLVGELDPISEGSVITVDLKRRVLDVLPTLALDQDPHKPVAIVGGLAEDQLQSDSLSLSVCTASVRRSLSISIHRSASSSIPGRIRARAHRSRSPEGIDAGRSAAMRRFYRTAPIGGAVLRRERWGLLCLHPDDMRTYVRALDEPESGRRAASTSAGGTGTRRWCVISTLPRPSRRVSTRFAPSRSSTGCPRHRRCRSGGRSTRIADALTPVVSWRPSPSSSGPGFRPGS